MKFRRMVRKGDPVKCSYCSSPIMSQEVYHNSCCSNYKVHYACLIPFNRKHHEPKGKSAKEEVGLLNKKHEAFLAEEHRCKTSHLYDWMGEYADEII